MADYISRNAVITHIRKSADEVAKLDVRNGEIKYRILLTIADSLEKFPPADVAPVWHGRWVPSKLRNEIERCSNCRKVFRHPSFYGYKFCPNCGAKMDLKGGAPDDP